MNAVKKVLQNSHFDQGVQNVTPPSLSLKIGHSLKKCIKILRDHALRRKDKGLEKDVDNFKNLLPQSGVTTFCILPLVLSAQRN